MRNTSIVGPGTLVDDAFRLVRELGRGSYGVVYEAEQVALGRRVAVKLLHPDAAMCAATRERFRREARIASSLRHPQAVDIYHCGFHIDAMREVPYIAMEYLEGMDLHELMVEQGRLSSDDTRALLRQALDPLIEAHDNGVVHRDIKPENLFLCRGANGSAPTVKILDFGIARAMEGSWGVSMLNRLTMRGGICGTPHYMAPELATAAELTPAVDVYSLGCIAYEMLAGRPPFDGNSPLQIVMLHCDAAPPPLPSSVHIGLRRAVERAMAKEPLARHQDARALAQALDDLDCDTDEWPMMSGNADTNEALFNHPLTETVKLVAPPAVAPATLDDEDPAQRLAIRTRKTDAKPAGTRLMHGLRSLFGLQD